LRASEELSRLLLDSIKDYAVYMLDPEGRVASWNAGAAKIKGYRAEEIIGKHFSCFYTAEDQQDGKPELELQKATASGRFEEEGHRVRKDGSVLWANVVITPVYDSGGALRGYSKVVRDITERKVAEEALRESQDRQALSARRWTQSSLWTASSGSCCSTPLLRECSVAQRHRR
jgi:PAS domain S-box-containing protein